MTREQCKEDVKRWQKDSATGGQFFSVDRLIDKIFSHFEVNEALHEAQLKDAEFAITVLNENLRLNGELLKERDKEIERLKNDFRYMQDVAIKKDVELCKTLEQIEELKDTPC